MGFGFRFEGVDKKMESTWGVGFRDNRLMA